VVTTPVPSLIERDSYYRGQSQGLPVLMHVVPSGRFQSYGNLLDRASIIVNESGSYDSSGSEYLAFLFS
jgi:hypothetical protein